MIHSAGHVSESFHAVCGDILASGFEDVLISSGLLFEVNYPVMSLVIPLPLLVREGSVKLASSARIRAAGRAAEKHHWCCLTDELISPVSLQSI